MARLAIQLFGLPGFAFDGEPWRFAAPPRCLPLLAYLALCPAPAAARDGRGRVVAG
jgi:DNA-binding SARP family transcriptional activator